MYAWLLTFHSQPHLLHSMILGIQTVPFICSPSLVGNICLLSLCLRRMSFYLIPPSLLLPRVTVHIFWRALLLAFLPSMLCSIPGRILRSWPISFQLQGAGSYRLLPRCVFPSFYGILGIRSKFLSSWPSLHQFS